MVLIYNAFSSFVTNAEILTSEDVESHPYYKSLIKEKILKILLKFDDFSEITIEYIDKSSYSYGYYSKGGISTFGNKYKGRYIVTTFPFPPKTTIEHLIRWNGYRVSFSEGETDFSRCADMIYFTSSCRLERVQYPNYSGTTITKENNENYKNYVQINDNIEDASLAHLLKISQVPLLNIINKDNELFLDNNYEIVLDNLYNKEETLKDILNTPDLKALSINSSRSKNGWIDHKFDILRNQIATLCFF